MYLQAADKQPKAWKLSIKPEQFMPGQNIDANVDAFIAELKSVDLPPEVDVLVLDRKDVDTAFSEYMNRVHDMSKDVARKLTDRLAQEGYTQRNDNYYVRVVKADKSASKCTNFVKITADNVESYVDILPVIFSMCPEYINEKVMRKLSSRTIFALIDDKGMPCAAAITSDEPDGVVLIRYLCSIIKSTGKNLFEHIVKTKANEGFTKLAIAPVNRTVGQLYKSWMGDRFFQAVGNQLFMYIVTDIPKPQSALELMHASSSFNANDKSLQAIETWVDSRLKMLDIARGEIATRLGDTRVLRKPIGFLFANVQKIGSGKYGVSYSGCFRYLFNDRCETFSLGNVHGREITDFEFYLVLKAINSITVPRPRTLQGLDRSGYYSGSTNPLREIVMGRLLNRLVKARVTPHFPLVYENFVDVNKSQNVLMEKCDADMSEFFEKLFNVFDASDRNEIIRVTFIQIVHALASGMQHYSWHHNDFHQNNIMVQIINNSVYKYKVAGNTYAVPNFGMCWKPIDYGFSSSQAFGASDNADAAAHSAAFRVFERRKLVEESYELTDITRLLESISIVVARSPVASVEPVTLASIQAQLQVIQEIVREVSGDSQSPGSLSAIRDAYSDKNYAEVKRLVLNVERNKQNLYIALFEELARTYKVDTWVDDDMTYDLNNPVDIPLEGIEAEFLYIDLDGKIGQKPVQEPPMLLALVRNSSMTDQDIADAITEEVDDLPRPDFVDDPVRIVQLLFDKKFETSANMLIIEEPEYQELVLESFSDLPELEELLTNHWDGSSMIPSVIHLVNNVEDDDKNNLFHYLASKNNMALIQKLLDSSILFTAHLAENIDEKVPFEFSADPTVLKQEYDNALRLSLPVQKLNARMPLIDFTKKTAPTNSHTLQYATDKLEAYARTVPVRQLHIKTKNTHTVVRRGLKNLSVYMTSKGYRQVDDGYIRIVREIPIADCQLVVEFTAANSKRFVEDGFYSLFAGVCRDVDPCIEKVIQNRPNHSLFALITNSKEPCAMCGVEWPSTPEDYAGENAALLPGSGTPPDAQPDSDFFVEYDKSEKETKGTTGLSIMSFCSKTAGAGEKLLGQIIIDAADRGVETLVAPQSLRSVLPTSLPSTTFNGNVTIDIRGAKVQSTKRSRVV